MKVRNRNHFILLYPENKKHQEALERIKLGRHLYILHDRDITDQGEIKKAHWHCIVSRKHGVWNSAVAKELGIELRLVQPIRNMKACQEYLLHLNEENKMAYDISEVKGDTKSLEEFGRLDFEQLTETEKALKIICFIEDNKGITIKELARVCALEGLWDVFRRSNHMFIQMLKE